MKEEVKISIFANLQSFNSKAVGLEEVVRMTHHDDILAQKTAAYRQMAKVISKEEAKKNIKEKSVEAFSVGVQFNGTGKRPEHVVAFTGLAMCDLDNINKDKMAMVKQRIVSDPHTMFCYETISGNGFRIIYRYQRQSPDKENNSQLDGVSWRAAFLCGNDYYQQLTGCEYDKGCSDYVRLSGMAHDAEAYYNPDTEPFVITNEMILEANFAQDTEAGKARREYGAGTQKATVEEAWAKVRQMLTKRGMEYAPSHRHDYILHACYLFNRFGVPDDELREWAQEEWTDFDRRELASIVSHCYKKGIDTHGTWRLSREARRKSHENTMITIAEIRQWLSDQVELIYNVVTDQTMIRVIDNSKLRIDNCHADDENRMVIVDDRVLASLRSQMAVDTDKRVLKNDVYDVIKSDFAPLVHPVRDYVNALPKWDGIDRVRELSRHMHAEALLPGQTDEEAQQELDWAFHKWHCATVGNWLDDRVTNHEVFTLIGRQGIYKTTFFRYLLPPELRAYFWENAHNTFSSKDDHLALSENCLVDIEEVEATGQRELSELKSLITSYTIKERRPYARFREAKHRLASLCATGNQQRFLTDETGNRRWLCFKVNHIDDPRTWAFDYQQLYAQLRDEFQSGFRYWFDYEDEQRVERINQPFRVESDEEQLIRMRLRPPREGEPVKLMNAAMVCQLLNGGHVGYPLSSRKISVAMLKMGFENVHTRQGNLFRVFEIPYDQVQSRLAADAYESVQEITQEKPTEPAQPSQTEIPF